MKTIFIFFTLTIFFIIQNGFASNLPDMLRCNQSDSSYQLILVLKSPQLPDNIAAIGLKKGTSVIFKVATQLYTDENNFLSFIEIPATANSKEAKLDLQKKIVVLKNFHLNDLSEGSTFTCQY